MNGNTDALLRLPITDKTRVFEAEYTNVNYIQNEMPTIDFKTVTKETEKNKVLKNIVKNMKHKTSGRKLTIYRK